MPIFTRTPPPPPASGKGGMVVVINVKSNIKNNAACKAIVKIAERERMEASMDIISSRSELLKPFLFSNGFQCRADQQDFEPEQFYLLSKVL